VDPWESDSSYKWNHNFFLVETLVASFVATTAWLVDLQVDFGSVYGILVPSFIVGIVATTAWLGDLQVDLQLDLQVSRGS
jgi:hypothetical protein